MRNSIYNLQADCNEMERQCTYMHNAGPVIWSEMLKRNYLLKYHYFYKPSWNVSLALKLDVLRRVMIHE